jgi:hypothetical protein
LTLSNEDIVNLLDQYDKESKAIKKDILKLMWHMRGSLSYDEAMMLSNEDKQIIYGIIEDNLEATKKSGLPYF